MEIVDGAGNGTNGNTIVTLVQDGYIFGRNNDSSSDINILATNQMVDKLDGSTGLALIGGSIGSEGPLLIVDSETFQLVGHCDADERIGTGGNADGVELDAEIGNLAVDVEREIATKPEPIYASSVSYAGTDDMMEDENFLLSTEQSMNDATMSKVPSVGCCGISLAAIWQRWRRRGEECIPLEQQLQGSATTSKRHPLECHGSTYPKRELPPIPDDIGKQLAQIRPTMASISIDVSGTVMPRGAAENLHDAEDIPRVLDVNQVATRTTLKTRPTVSRIYKQTFETLFVHALLLNMYTMCTRTCMYTHANKFRSCKM